MLWRCCIEPVGLLRWSNCIIMYIQDQRDTPTMLNLLIGNSFFDLDRYLSKQGLFVCVWSYASPAVALFIQTFVLANTRCTTTSAVFIVFCFAVCLSPHTFPHPAHLVHFSLSSSPTHHTIHISICSLIISLSGTVIYLLFTPTSNKI